MASIAKTLTVSGLLAATIVVATPFALSAVAAAQEPANVIPPKNAVTLVHERNAQAGITNDLSGLIIPDDNIRQSVGSLF